MTIESVKRNLAEEYKVYCEMYFEAEFELREAVATKADNIEELKKVYQSANLQHKAAHSMLYVSRLFTMDEMNEIAEKAEDRAYKTIFG